MNNLKNELQKLYEESSLYKEIFTYFSTRILPSKISDVYSIRFYAKKNKNIELSPKIIKQFFKKLEILKLGKILNNRQFSWEEYDLRNIGKLAKKEEDKIVIKKNKNEAASHARQVAVNFNLLSEDELDHNITNKEKKIELSNISTDMLINELFKRGYQLYLAPNNINTKKNVISDNSENYYKENKTN